MIATIYPSKPSILVVSQDTDDQTFLQQEFERRGFSAFAADSVEEACHLASSYRFVAIIEDLDLNRRERQAFMQEIKSGRYGDPLVFMFVSSVSLRREDVYALGAAGAFSKPVDPEMLVSRIKSLLAPADTRWRQKRKEQAEPRATFSNLTLSLSSVGSGGFLLEPAKAASASMIEGDLIRFAAEVKPEASSDTSFSLTGTGVVRYVKFDATNGSQRALGIEFQSLDDDSISTLMNRASGSGMPYIPRLPN